MNNEPIEQLESTTILGSNNLDNIEMQIRHEQIDLRKGMSTNFLNEIHNFIDMCFMLPKGKKENFVTKEKLKSILYKLIRTQKKFKSPENIFGEIRYLAVYDKETNEIGKLIGLDMINQHAEYISYYGRINKQDNKKKHWRDIYLFDYNSPQLEAMYNQYQANHQRELSFVEMTHFLETQDFVKTKQVKGDTDYGTELVAAEEHPIMKTIMLEYKIPENTIKRTKKKLVKIDMKTMEYLEEFDSVKEASDKLVISASTISNVLCQGHSAAQYKEAGGFRWHYSDKLNLKYVDNLVDLQNHIYKILKYGNERDLAEDMQSIVNQFLSSIPEDISDYGQANEIYSEFKFKHIDNISKIYTISKSLK